MNCSPLGYAAALGCAFSLACAPAASEEAWIASETPDPETVSLPAAEEPAVEAAPEPRRAPLAAAGYVDVETSPIVPFCSAVLIAPDVALTAASCAEAIGLEDAGFGLGIPGEGETTSVRRWYRLQTDDRLAALVLREAVAGVEPATLDAVREPENCAVQARSYLHVIRGETSDAWTWDGCLRWNEAVADLEPSAPVDQGPNCHGEPGAGVFDASGALLGVVVHAARRAEDDACVDALEVSVPARERMASLGDAFDEAMAMSEL